MAIVSLGANTSSVFSPYPQANISAYTIKSEANTSSVFVSRPQANISAYTIKGKYQSEPSPIKPSTSIEIKSLPYTVVDQVVIGRYQINLMSQIKGIKNSTFFDVKFIEFNSRKQNAYTLFSNPGNTAIIGEFYKRTDEAKNFLYQIKGPYQSEPSPIKPSTSIEIKSLSYYTVDEVVIERYQINLMSQIKGIKNSTFFDVKFTEGRNKLLDTIRYLNFWT